VSTSQYIARFHFARGGKTIGTPFEGVIKIREMHVRFRGLPLTFWHGFAQITHKQADRQFLIDHSSDPETSIFVHRQDGRRGRGVCVAREIEGSDFNMAIAGVESFS
jgi:hypothetical protein